LNEQELRQTRRHDLGMRVLAIDTALAACAAAVLDTGRDGIIASESLPMLRGHAEALMPLLARLMRKAGVGFRDLDRVVVTTGPGSFTGVRVGVSAARGIALAADKPAVGVSTLSAYAAPYLADDDAFPVVAAVDARHAQVYLQVFGRGGRTVIAARLAPLREAVQAAATNPARIVGSAAQCVADLLLATAARPILVDASAAPDIAWVARIGAALPEGQSPPKPQYLRAPDAQPQNAAQLPRR
jgi:tRNA threonylcarbamoyladenosine biosynthesis protein TsaB